MAVSLANQIAELEDELEDALRQVRICEERLYTLEQDVTDKDNELDDLSDRHASFVSYIEQIAPGAHNAWLIANKLE